jgi:hypothetical protein
MRILGQIIVVLASLAATAPAYADEAPPRIPTLDERIAQCRSMTGEQRDQCAVHLAAIFKDPTICARIPESRCAAVLATEMMKECAASSSDPKERLVCQTAVAMKMQSVESCKRASLPYGCIAAIASAKKDPQIILKNIDDPKLRDLAIANYAADARDPNAIELIGDNETYDGARIFIIFSIGYGRDRLIDPSYCNGLRGGYQGEYAEDNETSNRQLCPAFVAESNAAVNIQDAAETEAERDAAAARIRNLNAGIQKALERGDVTLAQIAAGLGVGGFNGTWRCERRGFMTAHQSGNAINVSFSGFTATKGDFADRKGGSAHGSVKGDTANFDVAWNDGTKSNMTITLEGNGQGFGGTWDWRKDGKVVGNGRWSCDRATSSPGNGANSAAQ